MYDPFAPQPQPGMMHTMAQPNALAGVPGNTGVVPPGMANAQGPHSSRGGGGYMHGRGLMNRHDKQGGGWRGPMNDFRGQLMDWVGQRPQGAEGWNDWMSARPQWGQQGPQTQIAPVAPPMGQMPAQAAPAAPQAMSPQGWRAGPLMQQLPPGFTMPPGAQWRGFGG